MKAGAEYSVVFSIAASLVCVGGCYPPDPNSVDGALAYAARAVEQHDTHRLFRILDQPSRHALDATFKARQEAARIIHDSYPPSEAPAALADLGDALSVKTSEELFAKRCDAKCLEWFSSHAAAPAETRNQGSDPALIDVRTVRDTTVTLRKGTDGWYGLVWRSDEWAAERDRAARDLSQVQENARVYSSRKRLETGDQNK